MAVACRGWNAVVIQYVRGYDKISEALKIR